MNRLYSNKKFSLPKILQLIARLILGGLFIYASIDKIAFPADFKEVIKNYNILPEFLVMPVTVLLPLVELLFGIFLVVGLFVKQSAIVLSSLVAVFMVALVIQAINGPIEDCGCFGKMTFLSSSNVYVLLIRDIVFLSLGFIILFFKKIGLLKENDIGKK